MTSLHTGSGSSSEDDDEDFSPVLPGVQLPAAPAPVSPASTAEELAGAPPLKREKKHDDHGDAHAAFASPQASEPSPSVAAVSEEALDEESWKRYVRQGLPSAALYERSFQHTALQDTYDTLAAVRNAHSGRDDQAATVTQAPAHTVHDMCVHYDGLGALIATVDSAGVVRVWRKLPRGLFFITELDRVFPTSKAARSSPGTGEQLDGRAADTRLRCHRTYWAHAYTALQILVFVCVEEDEIEAEEMAELLGGTHSLSKQVRVHLRQVNAVTFTVEERYSFAFSVPVHAAPLIAVSDPAVPAVAAAGTGQHPTTCPYSLAYTRRPVFLTHQYAPHIAFFVSMLPPGGTTSLPASMAASGQGGNGVLICPCFPSSTRASTTAAVLPCFAPTRLSVANPVVACVQQAMSADRAGTAPCVLVDAAGVLDYSTIEAVAASSMSPASSAGSSSSCASTGLTMRLIAGLAAVPPASREAQLWRQWIRFDKRQRTGFFSLARDAQQALKEQKEKVEGVASASPGEVQVMPLAVRLSPNGQHIFVWSLRWIRVAKAEAATAAGAHHSRIPATQRTSLVQVEECVHVFDFPSGLCVGQHAHCPVGGSLLQITEDVSCRATQWADHLKLRSRALAAQMHVEVLSPSTSSPLQYYVLLPELPLAHLLDGGAGGESARVTVTPSEKEQEEVKGAGRRVRVLEATLAGDARGSAATTAASPSSAFRLLAHGPGELELFVRGGHGQRQGMRMLAHEKLSASLSAAEPRLRISLFTPSSFDERELLGVFDDRHHVPLSRAPLRVLRCAVAPSQDLKNLIAASPLGAALGAEGRKPLFANPASSSFSASSPEDGVESLLLTTSVDSAMSSLLVYSTQLPFSGAALLRLFSTWRREGDEATAAANTPPTATSSRGTNAAASEGAAEEQWSKACQELHRERDYACGTLLMTTVAPPSSAGVPEQPAGTLSTNGTVQDAQEQQELSGDDALRRSTATAAADSLRPASSLAPKPGSPEAHIHDLLKDAVPLLATSPTKPPVVLVHVRGYGTIRVHLLPHVAPLASDNFIRLARRHYYDRLTFHRVIPGAIVQGGCPRGDGTGGESAFADGAAFEDEALELLPFFSHTGERQCCWLCMANAGPNTNGSQFFFTVPGGEAMPWLNGHHTVFGYAVEGLDVVRAMSVAARDEEDKPLSPIIIERVDVLSA